MALKNTMSDAHYNVLIVGAGWGGSWMLHSLRQQGVQNVKVVDCNKEIGGTWHYTRYPGCRNDVPVPEYQFSDEETWKDFDWDHRYPFQPEMQAYFLHVCKKLDLEKDMIFDRRVTSASWAERQQQWIVKLDDSEYATAKYLILSTGYTSKAVLPEIPGIENFEHKYHTSRFPADLDLAGKRVGVIGTGASGLQVIESVYDKCKELTVYHRTPNMATQRKIGHDLYNKKQEDEEKKRWPQLFEVCDRSSSGQSTDWEDWDISNETLKKEMWEKKWNEGNFWFGNSRALLNDEKYNRECYDFWRSKVAHRIKDPKRREILCPVEPPHPFGAKRPCHETHYFDAFNQDNVDLIDVNTDKIVSADSTGITTESGHKELDVIILASGFDAIVGSILNGINIRGLKNTDLHTKWNTRIRTNHGLAVSNFPNFFYIAGPQAPTVFGTTPRLSEIQAPYIASMIAKAGTTGVILPDEEGEEYWERECARVCPKLMWTCRTWYMRRTEFGKGPVQPACWYGGMADYRRRLNESKDRGFAGFSISEGRVQAQGKENGLSVGNGVQEIRRDSAFADGNGVSVH